MLWFCVPFTLSTGAHHACPPLLHPLPLAFMRLPRMAVVNSSLLLAGLGIACVALDLPVSSDEANAGLVPIAAAQVQSLAAACARVCLRALHPDHILQRAASCSK